MARIEQFGVHTSGAAGPFDIIDSRRLVTKQYVEISNIKGVMHDGGTNALIEIMVSSDDGATDPWKVQDDYLMGVPGTMVLDGKDSTSIVGPIWYKVQVTMGSAARISVKIDGAASGKDDVITRKEQP